jgi:hypothetical protein
MKHSFRSNHWQLLRAGLAAIAVGTALLWFFWTLILWFRWHPHIPWRDIFVILDDLRPLLDHSDHWQDWLFFIEPHYAAHRIAIPRMLVWMDVCFFHGKGHLLYASGWLAILTIFLVYARSARDYFRLDRTAWWFCASVMLALLFAPAHLWNLLNPVNTSWHVSFALAMLAFWALIRKTQPPRATDWLLAYVLATLSALANFAGVIAWLLLPVMALHGARRTLILAAVCSLALTLLYVHGLSSDAAIATSWTFGDPEAVAQIRETGRAALQGNTLSAMIQKTAIVLCWPLSLDHPGLAGIIFGLSIIVLAFAWMGLLLPTPGREAHPWLKLCILIASLALGVALAIQLGRMIEQPNHPHGPSYERYNTVVAIYWSGIFGLLFRAHARLSAGANCGLMAAVLVSLWLLLVPTGRYLKEEIISVETAAQLYTAGETPVLRGKPGKKFARFSPQYVYSFDALLESRKLAYAQPLEIVDEVASLSLCSSEMISFSVGAVDKSGFPAIRADIHGIYALLTRDVLVSEGGHLLARLYPAHAGGYSPYELIRDTGNAWQGHIGSRGASDGRVQVTLKLFADFSLNCALPWQALTAGADSVEVSKRVYPDV